MVPEARQTCDPQSMASIVWKGHLTFGLVSIPVKLYRAARKERVRLHYVHQSHSLAHDALLCVQTGALIADENRFRFHGDQHYLKSAAEMRSLFAEGTRPTSEEVARRLGYDPLDTAPLVAELSV